MTTTLIITKGIPTLTIRNKSQKIVTKVIIYDKDNNVKKEAVLNELHSSQLTSRIHNSSLNNPKRNIVMKFADKIFCS